MDFAEYAGESSAPAGCRLDDISPGLLVKRLGGKVEIIGPADRARFRIDADARKVGRVAQLLKHAAPFARREIDIADGPSSKVNRSR